jgi:hypothetical protein
MEKLSKFLTKSRTAALKQTEFLLQRRLYLSVLWVILIIFVGSLILMKFEDWSFITALYFVVQTIAVSDSM